MAVRSLCSARNTYSTSAALCSTFALTRSSEYTTRVRNNGLEIHPTVRSIHVQANAINDEPASDLCSAVEADQSGSRTRLSNLKHKSLTVRQLSATASEAASNKDGGAIEKPLSVGKVLEQDSRRLGQGSTYRNHESLRTSTASGTAEGSSTVMPGVRRGSEELPAVKRKQRRPYSMPAHMQKIAMLAGKLAQVKVKLSDTTTIEARKRLLDYPGHNIRIDARPQQQAGAIPWALSSHERVGKGAEEVLEEEIRRFVEYTDFTAMERTARNAVIADLQDLIAVTLGPGISSEVFGSERTGLASALSDIDVRLDCEADDSEVKHQILKTKTRALQAAMNQSEDYTLVTARYGRFPIINAAHRTTGMHLQIVAAPSTAPQDDITLRYMAELPHLRSLYLLLRSALGARNLVDVFNGGTGSYGLFIMLVASIKRPSNNPPQTMAQQLLRFLDFYADLDTHEYGISLTPPKLIKKHDIWEIPVKTYVDAAHRRGDEVRAAQWAISQRRLYQPYLLCLQDPVNPTNDLGRKSNAIKHVIATLKHVRTTLLQNMRSVDVVTRKKGKWREKCLLLAIVGYAHEGNAERRKRVEEYGLEIMAAQKRAWETENDVPDKEVAVGAHG